MGYATPGSLPHSPVPYHLPPPAPSYPVPLASPGLLPVLTDCLPDPRLFHIKRGAWIPAPLAYHNVTAGTAGTCAQAHEI